MATPPPGGKPQGLERGPSAGYAGRRDSLDSVDPAAIRGRRIVLDPGHGGFFPGTVGFASIIVSRSYTGRCWLVSTARVPGARAIWRRPRASVRSRWPRR